MLGSANIPKVSPFSRVANHERSNRDGKLLCAACRHPPYRQYFRSHNRLNIVHEHGWDIIEATSPAPSAFLTFVWNRSTYARIVPVLFAGTVLVRTRMFSEFHVVDMQETFPYQTESSMQVVAPIHEPIITYDTEGLIVERRVTKQVQNTGLAAIQGSPLVS